MTGPDSALRDLARRRWRMAASLTVAMVALYFGFVLLIAYNKPLMGSLVVPGLSVGILMGALVIVVSWLLTWFYARWANTHYDRALEDFRKGSGQ